MNEEARLSISKVGRMLREDGYPVHREGVRLSLRALGIKPRGNDLNGSARCISEAEFERVKDYVAGLFPELSRAG